MTDAGGALVEMPTSVAGGPGRILWAPRGLGTSSHSQRATETLGLRPCQPVHFAEVWPLSNTQFFPNGAP